MRLPDTSPKPLLRRPPVVDWRGRPTGASSSIVPQQAFRPGRERPVVPYCDHSSVYEEQCAPCLLRRLPPSPPTIGPRFVWRESVRRRITCYDHNVRPIVLRARASSAPVTPFVRVTGGFAGVHLLRSMQT